MGRVNFTTNPADTKITAAVTDRMIWPRGVCINTSYQSLFNRYISGMLPMTKITMIKNSFRGSAIRYTSTALTFLISEIFDTIGVRVVIRIRSCCQSLKASHHSRNTSLSILPRIVESAAPTSGFTNLTCTRKSWNTFDTGGFKYVVFSSTAVTISSVRK